MAKFTLDESILSEPAAQTQKFKLDESLLEDKPGIVTRATDAVVDTAKAGLASVGDFATGTLRTMLDDGDRGNSVMQPKNEKSMAELVLKKVSPGLAAFDWARGQKKPEFTETDATRSKTSSDVINDADTLSKLAEQEKAALLAINGADADPAHIQHMAIELAARRLQPKAKRQTVFEDLRERRIGKEATGESRLGASLNAALDMNFEQSNSLLDARPERAKVGAARDEITGRMQDATTVVDVLAATPESVSLNFQKGLIGAIGTIDANLGNEDRARRATESAFTEIDKKINQNRPALKPGSLMADFASAADSTALMMPAILTAAVTKMPSMAALTPMLVQEGGRRAGDMLVKGYSPEDAAMHGALFAVAEGVPERISLGAFAKMFGAQKGMRQAAISLGKSLGIELVTEQITTGTEFLLRKLSDEPNLTLGELAQEMKDTASSTAMGWAMMGGAGTGAHIAAKAPGAVADHLSPGRRLGRALDDAVAGTEFVPSSAESAAIQLLDPNGTLSVDGTTIVPKRGDTPIGAADVQSDPAASFGDAVPAAHVLGEVEPEVLPGVSDETQSLWNALANGVTTIDGKDNPYLQAGSVLLKAGAINDLAGFSAVVDDIDTIQALGLPEDAYQAAVKGVVKKHLGSATEPATLPQESSAPGEVIQQQAQPVAQAAPKTGTESAQNRHDIVLPISEQVAPVADSQNSAIIPPDEQPGSPTQAGNEPHLDAAKALIEKYKTVVGNKAAETKLKAQLRSLAAKTPQSHAKTALAIDLLATRLGIGDGKSKPLEFAQDPVPQEESAQPAQQAAIIVKASGKPFTESEAKLKLKTDKMTKTHKIVKVGNGFGIQEKPPRTEAQLKNDAKLAARSKKKRTVDFSRHTLLQAIAIHGVDKNDPWANDLLVSIGANKNSNPVVYFDDGLSLNLFRKDGKALDTIAGELAQGNSNYFDGHDRKAMIDTLAEDSDTLTPEGRMKLAEQEYAERHAEEMATEQERQEAAIAARDPMDEAIEAELEWIVANNGDMMTEQEADEFGSTFSQYMEAENDRQRAAQEAYEYDAGTAEAGGNPGAQGNQGEAQGRQPGEDFALAGQTEAEIAAEAKAKSDAESKAKAEEDRIEQKRKADAEVDSFELAGDGIDPNQPDMFGNSTRPENVSQKDDKTNTSTNTIFTEDAAAAARAILKKKLSGQLNTGIDPEVLQAGLTLAGYHIEKGARSFTAYAKAMIEDMGDIVKPYLKSWYLGISFDPRAESFAADMTDAGQVARFDIAELESKDTDTKAHEAATSPHNDKPQPSEAQIKSGNYEKGHVRIAGLDLAIENPEGSTRAGTDANGKGWSRKMAHHYGYIKGTIGKDKDHIDVFVKPGTPEEFAGTVFVIDQVNPGNGHFDEHKVMLGFDDIDEAKIAYRANYDKDWSGLKTISATPLSGFKAWLSSGDTTKPFKSYNQQGDQNTVEHDGDVWRVLSTGSTREDGKTFAHLASTTRGSHQNNGFNPVQINDWINLDGEKSETGPIERIVGDKLETNLPEVEHVTAKGKKIKGVISKTLTTDQAKAIDKFTWKKDGGYFIRIAHVVRPASTGAVSAITPENVKPISSAANEIRKIGADAFKNGDPRLPPDFMAPASKKEWLAGWDAANVSAPVESVSTDRWEGYEITPIDGSVDMLVREKARNGGHQNLARFSVKPSGQLGRINHFFEEEQTRSGIEKAIAKWVDETLAHGKQEKVESPSNVTKSGETFIGRNADGKSIYADKRGVRYYLDRGIKVQESVGIIPGGGIEILNRKDEYKSVDELAQDNQSSTLESNTDKEQGHEQPMAERAPHSESGNAQADRENGDAGNTGDGALGERVSQADHETGAAGETAGGGAGSSQPGGSRAPVRDGERLGGRDREPATVRDQSERPATSVSLPSEPKADFSITEEDALGEGGLKVKARNNLAAIKLVKKLAAEDRRATLAEQKTLSKYVGWGGIKGIFDEAKSEWSALRDEMKAALTPDEYAATKRSMLDAHYTSKDVVTGMWAAAQHIGFRGGRVLEPSVGVGNFFGMMPAEVRAQSQLFGVELDNITGQIAKYLYPNATVATPMGYQDVDLPSNSFDFAIGNPPFGDYSLYDKRHPELRQFNIHQFFFAKTLDKVRPGGIMQMVVSRYLMDSSDAQGFAARRYLGQRAKLLGAIRLPYNAFLSNANTEVVTDIIFLQKLQEGETGNLGDWEEPGRVDGKNKDGESFTFNVNRYFVQHPEMVVGEHAATGKMRAANQYNVEPRQGEPLMLGIASAAMNLPQHVYVEAGKPLADIASSEAMVPEGVKVYGYFMEGDKVMQRLPDSMGNKQAAPVEFKDAISPKRAARMIELRDTLRDLMRHELSADSTDAQIKKLRDKLNKQYDAFIGMYGYVNQMTNRRAFRDDPDLPLLESLEPKFDKGLGAEAAKKRGEVARKPSAEKADIFSKRVLAPFTEATKADSAQDALIASLNERGRIDPEFMAELYGKEWEAIVTELDGLVYHNPTGAWETADDYLSGNVKAKLKQAEDAAQRDHQYQANVTALQAVIPPDMPALKIAVRMGSPWVPSEVMGQFATELWGAKNPSIRYTTQIARWNVDADKGDETARTATWGTRRMAADEIMAHVMNNKAIVIKDNLGSSREPVWVVNEPETESARAKAQDMAAKFKEWIWQDEARRERLARIYNDNYNTDRRRSYDGSHLTLPGSSPFITLRTHQKNAIWRAIQDRTILLDHVVGAGKTYEMAGIAMELRRLGITRKPMFIVPNSLVKQWRDEFYKLYPNANVLAATENDFAKVNRKRFMAKIATGDWDAVVVAHSSFKKIAMPEQAEREILDEQLKDIANAIEDMKKERGDRNIMRDMEKIKKTLEEKLKALNDRGGKKDDTVSFDELGVDGVFLDEAHLFKNLYYTSQMRNVAGLGNPSGSGRAFDLFVKLRYLNKRYAGKASVVFATGTPVSNSLVEMFTMQRYLSWDGLKDKNLHMLDSWAGVYGDVQNVYEVHPSGTGYRLSTRFAKFVNLPSLMEGYKSFADVITMDDLKRQAIEEGSVFPVPKVKGGKPRNIIAERSEQQTRFFGVPEFKRAEGGRIQFKADGLPSEYGVHPSSKTPGKWFIARGQGKIGQEDNYDSQQDAQEALDGMLRTPLVGWNNGSILWKFENLKALNKESKGKINALSVTNEARKAGLDYRLINPSAPDFKGSKINLAVAEILRIHKAWKKDKGAQLVFCDLSVPQSARVAAAAKERDAFVRKEGGDLEKVKATIATIEDMQERSFLVVKRGSKDSARFMVYDGLTGADMEIEADTRAGAVAALAQAFSNDLAIRDRLELYSEIDDSEIADWKDANEQDDSEDEEGDGAISVGELLAMAGGAKFSVYDDIKAKLIAQGIPEKEVAFIHDYDTAAKKNELFKKVRDGEIRVLIGSTEKMGAGMNVQERLVALHHLDAPWRPSDLEQREGRIVRQGNALYKRDPDGFEVEINRYGTRQTYDTRMWQIIEHKAAGVEQLRKASDDMLEIDDVAGEAANSADMKAAASGNPLILDEIRLRNEVKSLEAQQFGHLQARVEMERKIKSYRQAPEYAKDDIDHWEGIQALREQHPAKPFHYAIRGFKATELKDASGAITESFVEAAKSRLGEKTDAGTYRGMNLVLFKAPGGIFVRMNDGTTITVYDAEDKFSPSGFFQRIDNFMDKADDHLDDINKDVQRKQGEIPKLEAEAAKPFTKDHELADKRKAHRDVVNKLSKSGGGIELLPEMKRELDEAIKTRGLLFSKNSSAKKLTPGQRTIMVDGVERPAQNSEGQPIHWSVEGVRNFWRWADGIRSSGLGEKAGSGKDHGRIHRDSNGTAVAGRGVGPTFDAHGRPIVFVHGTRDDITAFDLNHGNRKDSGWLGRGVYVTTDHDIARWYAEQKQGDAGQNIMPLYVALKNPYMATVGFKKKLKHASQAQIDDVTHELKRLGHDGVVLDFGGGVLEVVAFNPSDVKSSIGNSGAFSGATDDLRYSIANNSTIGISKSSVQSIVDAAIAKYPRLAGVVHVVQSVSDLPTDLRHEVYYAGAQSDIEGVYHGDGMIYLVADHLPNELRARKVLAHESVGHMAMEDMLNAVDPKLWDSLVRQVTLLERSGNKLISSLAAEVDESRPGLDKITRVKEILAKMAEDDVQNDPRFVGQPRTTFQRFIDGIKAFMKLVFDVQMTDKEVLEIVKMAERYLSEKGESAVVSGVKSALASRKGDKGNLVDGQESALFNTPELLAGFDAAETIEIQAPAWTEQEIKDLEARFLSSLPEGIRYTNSARLLGRIRQASQRASDAIGSSPETARRITSMVGPFTGGRTSAYTDSNGHGAEYLVIDFYGDEQLRAGLDKEPALSFLVRDSGELIVQGPFPGGKTFEEFKKRGWATEATGANGEVLAAWSRLIDPNSKNGKLPNSQVIELLADVHARAKAWRMDPKVGLFWTRSTGALGGLEGSLADKGTAVFFSRKATPIANELHQYKLRQAKRATMADDVSLSDRVLRGAFRLTKADRLIDWSFDKVLGFTGELVPETVKAGLVSDYGLTEDYIDRKADMKAAEAAQARKTSGMIEMLSGLTRAESRVAYQWMQEKPESAIEQRLIAQLPDTSRETLAKLKTLITELGMEAVRLGQLSSESQQRNSMSYLHRTYAKHVLNEEGAIAKMLRARSMRIKGSQYKGRGIFEEVPMDRIMAVHPVFWRKLKTGKADIGMKGEKLIRFERRDASTEYMDALDGFEKKPMGKLREVVYWPASVPVPQKFGDWVNSGTFEVRDTRGDKLVVWRDLTKEERDRLGELDEVRYAVAQTISLMTHDIEVGRFFEWTASHYAKPEPEGREVEASEGLHHTYGKDTWVQVPASNIPGTKVKKYGKLAGLYVPGPVWNDLRQVAGYQQGAFQKLYGPLLRFWKKSKTAWSPGVHVNNVVANFILADWHDIKAMDMAEALKVWAKNKQPGYKELFERFEDSGALGGMFMSNEALRDEINQRLEEMKAELTGEQDAEAETGKMAKVLHLAALAGVPFKGYAKHMGNAYQNEDAFFRLAVFLKAVRYGKSDREAGRLARHAFLNYDINAPWVQAARHTVLPFISFTYRALPMLVDTVQKKPWKIVKLMAFASLVDTLAYAMLGMDDDDEDKERKLLPDQKQGKVWGIVPKMLRMPWNSDSSAPVFLDVRRWVPVGDVMDLEQGHGLPPSLVPGGPLVALAEVMLFNKSLFTQKEITLATDGLTEATHKKLDYAFKAIAPNVPVPNPLGYVLSDETGQYQSYAWGGIEKAIERKENTIGEVRTPAQAGLNAVGVKIGSYPKQNMVSAIQIDARKKVEAIKDGMKKDARDYERIANPSPSDMKKRDAELKKGAEKIQQVHKETGRRLGLSDAAR